MITITPCIIELDVDSTRSVVYDGNKIRATEHKGQTSVGNPIYFFALYGEDEKDSFFGYYTPFELIQSYGTYQVIYI